MAPLLAAFARGTRRSRLRQLVVVCPAGHALVEVFPTGVGPVAVWRRRDAWQLVAGEATYLDHQLTWLAAPLTETVDGADGEDGAGKPDRHRPTTRPPSSRGARGPPRSGIRGSHDQLPRRHRRLSLHRAGGRVRLVK